MAGSELRGLAGARADLFQGCTWVLTPTSLTKPETYGTLHGILRELGANVVAVDADDHDRLVAVASHVPHLLAGALMNEASRIAEQDAILLQLAAGGFRDMTRVAAGDPSIWPDVLFENRVAISQSLQALEERLASLRAALSSDDHETIAGDLMSAASARRQLPGRALHSENLAYLRVAVSDQPGVLAAVTMAASEALVNIYDIEIAHGIEGSSGTLLLAIDERQAESFRHTLVEARLPGRSRMSDVERVAHATQLRGSLRVPGDKSSSHRALMISALASGESSITGLSPGEDVAATSVILQQLGATRRDDEGVAYVRGPDDGLHPASSDLDCGNSGTTMRLMSGIVGSIPGTHHLIGDASLSRRPMDRIATPLGLMGIEIAGEGPTTTPPLTVNSPDAVRHVDYHVPVASAQVKSAVLLAGLFADGVTRVREDVRTRRTTEDMLREAGVSLESRDVGEGREVELSPGRPHRRDWHVPGDPSQAAFFAVLGAIHPDASLEVLSVEATPERVGFVGVLQRMGARVTLADRGAYAALRSLSSSLQATEIHSSEVPSVDEVPVLTVAT